MVQKSWFNHLGCIQTGGLTNLTGEPISATVKSRYIGDGHHTFNRNPYNRYMNPYYWVDEFIPYYMEMSWELIDPGT